MIMNNRDADIKECLQTLEITNLNAHVFADQFHELAKAGGWWNDLQTGEPLNRNKGELLCLIHSEISEALEGERKNSMDKHLPNRREAEVELADAVIRIFDYAGAYGYDIIGAMVEKAEYNTKRADHKVENRKAEHGKKY